MYILLQLKVLIVLSIFPFASSLDEFDISQVSSTPVAHCDFAVHRDGPDGEFIKGANLEVKLYYDISCKPEKGYCLHVSNCTVRGDGSGDKPYPIIDHNGCTLEPSLFEDVQYVSDFRAGILNPLPIRFRGQSSTVLFYCATSFKLREGPICKREACPPQVA